MDMSKRRAYWVDELILLSGSFGNDTSKLLKELESEIKREGITSLMEHLRFCGALPEKYGHDSSEEKLYSKYTDALLSECFTSLGLSSVVLTTRADSADVQATANDFSLVADAKAFRLSRTAKNQKDFKIQAMDGWRDGLDYAIVVSPIYQLPNKTSQIYQQAISRNVCILSYTHLSTLVALGNRTSKKTAQKCLHDTLKTLTALNPSKDASEYWMNINKSFIAGLENHVDIWVNEKKESIRALELVKLEGVKYLRLERDRILKLSHSEAIKELVAMTGLEARISKIESITHGNLLGD